MAQTIPQWLLGQHLTAISVAPITFDSAGLITVGTARPISGYIDGVEISPMNRLEMIQSIDQLWAHNQPIMYDTALKITEIKGKKTTVYTPVLNKIFATYLLGQVTFTMGAEVWTGAFAFEGLRDGINAFGKNTMEATFMQIDTTRNSGTAPVVFTAPT